MVRRRIFELARMGEAAFEIRERQEGCEEGGPCQPTANCDSVEGGGGWRTVQRLCDYLPNRFNVALASVLTVLPGSTADRDDARITVDMTGQIEMRSVALQVPPIFLTGPVAVALRGVRREVRKRHEPVGCGEDETIIAPSRRGLVVEGTADAPGGLEAGDAHIRGEELLHGGQPAGACAHDAG